MKIDELPVELLMKLFSYVPFYFEASLVNKLFYDIVCQLNDPNICLSIKYNPMPYGWLESMRRTNRVISKVEIGPLDHSIEIEASIVSVVEHRSATITFLALYGLKMDKSTILNILSAIPNVEQLSLKYIRFTDNNEHQPLKRQRCNDFLNLKKLRSVRLFRCDHQILDYLVRIPVGILAELTLCHFELERLIDVLNCQLNIKKLCLDFIVDSVGAMDIDIFDKLQLESLELDGSNMNSVSIASILSKLPVLKSLILSDITDVDDRVMTAVTDLLELNVLALNVTKTPDESFVKIRKLRKLTDLRIKCDSDRTSAKFKILAKSDNTSIVKLQLTGFNEMPVDLIHALAESAPHLKVFNALSTKMNQLQLDSVMCHFNFVENLQIPIDCDPSVNQSNCFNPALKELVIDGGKWFNGIWMARLVADYPNLKKLKVSGCHRYQTFPVQVKTMVDGFKKLETLRIKRFVLTTDDVNSVLPLKKNLKFVYLKTEILMNFSYKSVDELRTMFGAMVRMNGSLGINVAVDQYTMNCECYDEALIRFNSSFVS